MVDTITFDIGAFPSVELQLASSEGLAPLPIPQPPPDAVRRFQAAMEDDISHEDTEPQREYLAQSSPSPQSVLVTDAPIDPSRTLRTSREENLVNHVNPVPETSRTSRTLRVATIEHLEMNPIVFDIGGARNPVRVALPDVSGLKPLELPPSLLGNVERFQQAIATPAATTAATVSRPPITPVASEAVDTLAPVSFFTDSNGTTLPYRLYVPEPSGSSGINGFSRRVAEPQRGANVANWKSEIGTGNLSTFQPFNFSTFPLILFMHGAGTRGDDGTAFTGNISFKSLLSEAVSKTPAIVLAPQCPVNEKWVDTPWEEKVHAYNPAPSRYMAAALELLDRELAALPVDRTRIYVCGNSMGGYATWDLLSRRPDLFAAAIPVCGGGTPEKVVEASRTTPVWTVHGDADDVVPVENTRSIVAAVRADSAHAADFRYREMPGVKHDCWTATFTDPEIMDWFFAQRREMIPSHEVAETQRENLAQSSPSSPSVLVTDVPIDPLRTLRTSREENISHEVAETPRGNLAQSSPSPQSELPHGVFAPLDPSRTSRTSRDENLVNHVNPVPEPSRILRTSREEYVSHGDAETQQGNLAQSSPSPQSELPHGVFAPVEPSRTLRTSREEKVSHGDAETQRENLAQSSPSPQSELPHGVFAPVDSSRTLRTSREENISQVEEEISSHGDAETRRDPNVANVEVLPIANANVANRELGIGTGNTGNIANLQPSTQLAVDTVNQIVEAVAAEIAVTPALAGGDGEIRIMLKPSVLDGSEIRLTAKAGELTVAIAPATPEAAALAAAALPRLETALAAHAPSFHHVAVVLAAGKKGTENETA